MEYLHNLGTGCCECNNVPTDAINPVTFIIVILLHLLADIPELCQSGSDDGCTWTVENPIAGKCLVISGDRWLVPVIRFIFSAGNGSEFCVIKSPPRIFMAAVALILGHQQGGGEDEWLDV